MGEACSNHGNRSWIATRHWLPARIFPCSRVTSFRFWIGPLTDKPITGSVHGEEVLRLFGVGFEFLAQTHQVRIHSPGGWVVLVSPNFFQKTIAAQRFAGVTDEIFQQLEFRGGNIESLA